MSALPQSNFANQYYSPTPQFQTPEQNQIRQKNYPPQVGKVIKHRQFKQQNKLPQNLQLLSLLQKTSFGLALVSMAASTGLYISTVQTPRLWSQEYRNLENLQRQERQLIMVNETIKYQIAQEASQDNRLSISNPESAVFIAPAQVTNKTLSSNDSKVAIQKISDRSLGY